MRKRFRLFLRCCTTIHIFVYPEKQIRKRNYLYRDSRRMKWGTQEARDKRHLSRPGLNVTMIVQRHPRLTSEAFMIRHKKDTKNSRVSLLIIYGYSLQWRGLQECLWSGERVLQGAKSKPHKKQTSSPWTRPTPRSSERKPCLAAPGDGIRMLSTLLGLALFELGLFHQFLDVLWRNRVH